ncbi:hypothetical protein [Comamonas sp. JC664]|uniref:hypothetical protein n=1 Tax=Comamonas sp. JC664 TaxID=2801917 RepID=UPI00174AA642|nr:hypothetical protein [Comamonas sp. JC664]MBL0697682.1 hypothetical protein [Comamonas sp. JC664]GHG68994.1 hypothetical protein GCM10012319_12740 [Comamonas sp. KCTC 72670]
MTSFSSASRRGSALAITLIALTVLLMLVVGAITFTGRNQSAAVSKMRGDRVEACAETARRHLLSRLKVFGAGAIPVTSINLEQVLMDDEVVADRSTMRTAHVGDTASAPTAAVLASSSFSSGKDQVSDAANTLREGTTGGSYYRVVVMCGEPGGRQAETEFVFRFGI